MLDQIFHWLGGATCHQWPARTLVIDGHPLPLCVRCTGVYFSVVVTTIYLLLRRRLKAGRPLSVAASIILAASMLPLMADGGSAALGLRESNNLLRIMTGALYGYGLPILYVMVRNFSFTPQNDGAIVKARELPLLICIVCLGAAALFFGTFSSYTAWVIVSAVSCLGLTLVFYGGAYLALTLAAGRVLPVKRRRIFAFVLGVSLLCLMAFIRQQFFR